MNFDFSELSTANAFKLLSSVVVPRPIAWVVSQSAQGRRNAAPFSFFNVVSSDPPIVALGIGPRGGQLKDTSRNILETGEFVINLVSVSYTHLIGWIRAGDRRTTSPSAPAWTMPSTNSKNWVARSSV